MKSGFFNFLWRYPKLFITWAVLVILGRFDGIVINIGHVYYVVELVFSAIVAALLIRHLFFTSTLDAYSTLPPEGESMFTREWNALDAKTRITLALIGIWVLYLGAAWIAASIAKGT